MAFAGVTDKQPRLSRLLPATCQCEKGLPPSLLQVNATRVALTCEIALFSASLNLIHRNGSSHIWQGSGPESDVAEDAS